MKKILIVMGTRPEAIKLLPLMREFNLRGLEYAVLNTNQHSNILDFFLHQNKITPEYRLQTFGHCQSMIAAKAKMLLQMGEMLSGTDYSCIIVQGDTLSSLVGAEYGFFSEIPVLHVEAGMRTYNSRNPYPEETIRRMISSMASIHFCPSENEQRNLISEKVDKNNIYVVGNTFADYRTGEKALNHPSKKQILITIHRRENLPYLDGILKNIAALAREKSDYHWLFPVHPNPEIIQKTKHHLSGIENITLCPPLSAADFYKELISSELIISDSGGVQEECLLNNKKIIVLREVSERITIPDFIEQVPPDGNLKDAFFSLINRDSSDDFSDYYGKGNSAKLITDIIFKEVTKWK